MYVKAIILNGLLMVFCAGTLMSAAFTLAPSDLEKKYVRADFSSTVVDLKNLGLTIPFNEFFAIQRTLATLCENGENKLRNEEEKAAIKVLLAEILEDHTRIPLSDEARDAAEKLLTQTLDGTPLYETYRYNFINSDGTIDQETQIIIQLVLYKSGGLLWYGLMAELDGSSIALRKQKLPKARRKSAVLELADDDCNDDNYVTALEFLMGNRKKQ